MRAKLLLTNKAVENDDTQNSQSVDDGILIGLNEENVADLAIITTVLKYLEKGELVAGCIKKVIFERQSLSDQIESCLVKFFEKNFEGYKNVVGVLENNIEIHLKNHELLKKIGAAQNLEGIPESLTEFLHICLLAGEMN
ncbi:hypothetical protein EIN_222020 [Entamoeba invadens IP1]|uniref:Uncharacterized protein n=1 Tax=Entamoeba invadens IP1 TaxID=370355 RepID=A0A0A1U229_ENTIV|nr:hypothetical protein EIN_222020 [Entamoeba invadens IP1]ELP88069.1 hypothetical protein EIN_222020 [Entamoeba invadens IP1]|eukprot:XP_004254840.1 hypothetical protein EIN_222020 [Entamoeba invadens IP1]